MRLHLLDRGQASRHIATVPTSRSVPFSGRMGQHLPARGQGADAHRPRLPMSRRRGVPRCDEHLPDRGRGAIVPVPTTRRRDNGTEQDSCGPEATWAARRSDPLWPSPAGSATVPWIPPVGERGRLLLAGLRFRNGGFL
jgi:hypothetical protein